MSDLTPMPTEEMRQRAEWDLLLRDLEYRAKQSRLADQDYHFKPWQIGFTGMTAGAALFAAALAFLKLVGV